METKRRWQCAGATIGLGLVVLLTVATRVPRSELSSNLDFLRDMSPLKSGFVDQNYKYSDGSGAPGREVFALVEEFEIRKSFREVCDLARTELKPRAFHASSFQEAGIPKMLYSVADPRGRWSTVVTIRSEGLTMTSLRFVTVCPPSIVDRAMTWLSAHFGH